MNRHILIIFVSFVLAQGFGSFTPKSLLTTYTNTLLENTIFDLGTQQLDSFTSIAADVTTSGGNSATPGGTLEPSTTLTTMITSPTPISYPPLDHSSHHSSSGSGSASLLSGPCSIVVISRRETLHSTETSYRVFTETSRNVMTTRIYQNSTKTTTKLGTHGTCVSPVTSTTTTTATTTSTVVVKGHKKRCDSTKQVTVTQVVYNVKDIQGLLLGPAATNEIGSYETIVNGSTLLYIYPLPSTPAWPYYNNNFPKSTSGVPEQTKYPAARVFEPTSSQKLTGRDEGDGIKTSFGASLSSTALAIFSIPSNLPIFTNLGTKLDTGSSASAYEEAAPYVSLQTTNTRKASPTIDPIMTISVSSAEDGSFTSVSTAVGASPAANDVTTGSSSSALVTQLSTQYGASHSPARERYTTEFTFQHPLILATPTPFISTRDATCGSSFCKGPLNTFSAKISGLFSESVNVSSMRSSRSESPYNESSRTVSDRPSHLPLAAISSSQTSTASLISSPSLPGTDGGSIYNCGEVNPNSDSLLVCKKNRVNKAKPMPVGMQALIYTLIFIILVV